MTSDEEATRTLICSTLEVAVPMWIDRLKQQPFAVVMARAKDASQTIAEHGDIILYKSKKKGETAKAFNALAEGVAILAFMPGGVKIFGGSWIASHPDGVQQG